MIMNRIRKEVEHNLHGSGVLPFLRSQFNLKLRKAVQMIDEGRVEVLNSLASKGKPVNLGYKLCAGDVVQLHSKNELQNEKSVKKEVTIPKLEILYKDDHLLALNKPAGLAVQGGSKIHKSLENVLEEYSFDKSTPPKLVHRLDKDASGVLLLARTKEMARILSKQFQESEKYLKKIYLAMLLPDFDGKTVPKTDLNIVRRIDTGMFIETTSYGQELSRLTKYDEKDPFTNTGVKIQRAITDYVYLGSTKDHGTMALFSPVTGRKHQIRVHASQVLHRSIVGDFKYGHGVGKRIRRSLPGVFPMMLHCRSVTLKDYFGKELTIRAQIGNHFRKCTNATGMGRFNQMPWPENESLITETVTVD